MNEQLKRLVAASRSIVFFGGAGVSTESGIPDFRSADGLWSVRTKYGCSPEEVVSQAFFARRPEEFYEFFWQRMVFKDIRPNITHLTLAEWERQGRLSAVVTQNIDGLHQAAGSRNVYELHGTVRRYGCLACGRGYDLAYAADPAHRAAGSFIPRCACGGMLKPDVVLFGEALRPEVLEGALQAIQRADLLIVGGTSLVVYPAAGLVGRFRGGCLALINKQTTPYDDRAQIVIHDSLGKVFAALAEQ